LKQADAGHSGGPALQNGVDIFRPNAAEPENRDRHGSAGFAQKVQAHRWTEAGLRFCRKHMSYEDVVGILLAGAHDLLHGVDRDASEETCRKPLSYIRNLQTGRRKMNPMRACSQCDISPAVHQDFALCAARHVYYATSQFKQSSFVQVLFANLNEADAPVKGSLDATGQGYPGQPPAIGDVIKKRTLIGKIILSTRF